MYAGVCVCVFPGSEPFVFDTLHTYLIFRTPDLVMVISVSLSHFFVLCSFVSLDMLNVFQGYTIPLDKRLAADGRGLQTVHINENFAKLAEALYIADRKVLRPLSPINYVFRNVACNMYTFF